MNNKDNSPDRHLSIYRRRISLLYFTALILMFFIICINIWMKEAGGANYGLRSFTAMDEGWYTQDGKAFEIRNIDLLRSEDSAYVSIYHPLPDRITKGESIVFRSKNCLTSVWKGGVEVYSTDMAEAPFYNHSPGTRWNIINVNPSDSGAVVELRITQAYQDGRAKVDNFYYGDRASIILNLIDSKISGFIISLLIFFVALVFFAAWAVLNWHRTPKDNSLLWLAVFAAVASFWCMLETNLFQFFSPNLRLLQTMDDMMLVIGGLPLFLYMDSVYHIFRYRIIRVLCGLDIIYILLATLSQILGLWDYHQTLDGAVITYGMAVVILVGCLAKQHRKYMKTEYRNNRLFYYLQQLGILMLSIGLLGDLIRYLISDILDRAFIIRIGLLCFILCFGASNIYHMTRLVKKGMESDLISQLAYLDGLTKTGNRTAYTEQLQRLKTNYSNEALAVVMFDINNLKRVNDTLGHKSGDDLILCCADILLHAFSPPWKIYRIGGDEFVALTHGGEVKDAYCTAHAIFCDTVRDINRTGSLNFEVIIACGAAFTSEINESSVRQAEQDADRSMYQNKYELKCQEAGISS